MPSVLEYWSSMPYTTSYGYLKRYPTIEQILEGVIRHASEKNIAIFGNGEHLNVEMLKACCNQQRKKRSLIQQRQPPIKRQKLNDMELTTTDVVENIVSDFTDTIVPDFTDTIVPDFTDTIVPDFTDTIVPDFTDTIVPDFTDTIVPDFTDTIVPDFMDTADVEKYIQVPVAITPTLSFNGILATPTRKPLVLNGLVIEVDPVTFMVNATMMCKAVGKLFGDYHRQKKTEEYLSAISLDMGIPISKLVQRNQSGRGTSQDTNVHFRVALHLAYWLSTTVQVQFSKWIAELRNENAASSTQIEELQATAADSASATVITTTSAHLPNVNGARRVVPTNTLVLNGLAIEVDPVTFMVNATQMCKAAGKRWIDYRRNDTTESYLKEIESKVGIPTFDLIQSKPGHNGGTMVHRLIAYDLASWLSGDIKLQFYMWNDELLLTGRVELGKEMNVQQLEDVWKRRIEEGEAKASADVKAEQDRCRKLELRLTTIQEARQQSDEENRALVAIKTRDDLETAVQFQARATAPTISSYKEGDNVLYLARVDGTKFKYGCSKNVGRRFDTHRRPGVYPTFEPIGVLPCANAVASEDQVRAYVKKTNIGVEYGTQREIVKLETVDALQRMMNKMQKCCRQRPASEGSEVLLWRIEVKASIKMKKIDARVDMEKIKAELEEKKIAAGLEEKKIAADLEEKKMDVGEKNKDREMKKLQMVLDGLINFDQFLLIK
jgi:hypothetical protein